MIIKKMLIVIAIWLLLFYDVSAQTATDTIQLSFKEAEKYFLLNNLSLLSSKYNVDINKALIKQARLWDNPIISTDQNIYDGKYFQHNTNNGQVYVQVMQLIKTGGKRTKAAQLASDNTSLAQEQFDDLLHNLRYTLQNDLLELSHQLKIKIVFTAEIAQVNKLIAGMDLLLQPNNASDKDNVRVKALLFSLQNELVNAEVQLMSIESELKLLLNNNETKFISPKFDFKFGELTTATIPNINELVQQALIKRPDARIAQTGLLLQQHNFTYQQALAKPDVSIGTEYDQRSNYANNYVGLAITLPINIFNANQGNIAAAKISIQQQQAVTDFTVARIKTDVTSAVNKFIFFQGVNNRQQLNFSEQYDALFASMLKSYAEKKVSLLEFIDFMDTYKDTKLKLLEQHNGLIHAAADLNYAVASDVIHLN